MNLSTRFTHSPTDANILIAETLLERDGDLGLWEIRTCYAGCHSGGTVKHEWREA